LRAATWSKRFDRTLAPQAREVIDVEWHVPEATGVYYLAAVTRREGDRPAVSQRVVRSLQPPADDALAGRSIAVLGGDEAVTAWCTARGARVCGVASNDIAQADVVLIWNPMHLSAAESNALATVRNYAEHGGRVVAFLDSMWDAAPVAGCTVTNAEPTVVPHRDWGYRRVFPCALDPHPLVERIRPDGLVRWNGFDAKVCIGGICLDAAPNARKLYWGGSPERLCMAAIPVGEGEVIVTSMLVRNRITRGSTTYDPSAEEVLVALLTP
jgi:hypothetical protein